MHDFIDQLLAASTLPLRQPVRNYDRSSEPEARLAVRAPHDFAAYAEASSTEPDRRFWRRERRPFNERARARDVAHPDRKRAANRIDRRHREDVASRFDTKLLKRRGVHAPLPSG